MTTTRMMMVVVNDKFVILSLSLLVRLTNYIQLSGFIYIFRLVFINTKKNIGFFFKWIYYSSSKNLFLERKKKEKKKSVFFIFLKLFNFLFDYIGCFIKKNFFILTKYNRWFSRLLFFFIIIIIHQNKEEKKTLTK